MKYKIKDINQNYQNIDIIAKILSVDKRVTKNEKGETTYYYGILGDDTGTIPFTAWTLIATVKSGDAVEIKNGSSNLYNGKIRFYIDSRSQVILKPNEDIEVKRVSDLLKIRDIPANAYYVSVIGRITGISQKKYIRDGQERLVYQGYIEDETARVRISSFGKKLEENSTVKIDGAKVSQFNGYLGLSIGETTEIEKVKAEIPEGKKYMLISEIKSPVGGITVNGFVISVGANVKINRKCSVCRKILEDDHCKDHPDAPAIFDLFGYFLISDGTEDLMCFVNSDSLLPFINMKADEFQKRAYEINLHPLMEKNLKGKCLSVSGNIRSGNNGFSLRVTSIKDIGPDDVKSVEKLVEEEFQ